VSRAAGHVLFEHLANRADEDIDLAAAALLIAESEYPDLDVAHYLGMLDAMAETVRRRCPSPERILAELSHYLFEELGFRGNDDDYYDPRNSYLNEVLDRRVGIPITLSLVLLEVGTRLGLELHGVSFPGHFLVRVGGAAASDQVIDPYHRGVALEKRELEDRLKQALGDGAELEPQHLQVASKKQVLTRMLNNLRGIYQRKGDSARELVMVEKLTILNPKDQKLGEAADLLRKRESGSSLN
jgi:regulator of sirC expression with transglutaminase-like and TPR domain